MYIKWCAETDEGRGKNVISEDLIRMIVEQ